MQPSLMMGPAKGAPLTVQLNGCIFIKKAKIRASLV